MAKITEHFTTEEMYCRCKACKGKEPPTVVKANLKKLCEKLEILRAAIIKNVGREVYIIPSSGYRCDKHNANVGGVAGSEHTDGEAVDFSIKGISSAELFTLASGGLTVKQVGQKPKGLFTGVGYYPEKPNRGPFVHVDIAKSKKRPATWKL